MKGHTACTGRIVGTGFKLLYPGFYFVFIILKVLRYRDLLIILAICIFYFQTLFIEKSVNANIAPCIGPAVSW